MRCLWKLTKPESVLRSEGAEDQRLPEHKSLNLSINSLISSALMQVVECFKEQDKCSFENRFTVVIKTQFLTCKRRTWTLKPLFYRSMFSFVRLTNISSWLFCVRMSTLSSRHNNSKTKHISHLASTYRKRDLITFWSTMLHSFAY